MAYLTRNQVLQAAQRRPMALSTEIRESAAAPLSTVFDIFLSHSYEDAALIPGVVSLLASEGLTVYVDWQVDAELNRKRVTAANAAVLRDRMDHCRMLLYVASRTSPDSRWMPWELGYFDGKKSADRIRVLPIVNAPGQSFVGLEYLSLYRAIEQIQFLSSEGSRLGEVGAQGFGRRLTTLARG